jgi:hypothetical protein
MAHRDAGVWPSPENPAAAFEVGATLSRQTHGVRHVRRNGAEMTQNLYDVDFYEWCRKTAAALRAGDLREVDIEHVAEEIEDMGKRDLRELESRLKRILEHKLKLEYLPLWMVERNRRGWMNSIREQAREGEKVLRDSPSLRRCLRDLLPESYRHARIGVEEKFPGTELPKDCPWTLAEILGEEAVRV